MGFLRFLFRLTLVAGILAGWAAWWVLRIRRDPPARPLPEISPEGAREWVTATGGAPVHDDLQVTYAPAHIATFELHPEGANFYPRILEDIAAAERSVHVIQYGFKPGKIADLFVPVLSERAKAGVPVRLLLDSIGSAVYTESKAMLDELAAAGVQIAIHDAAPPRREGLVPDRRIIGGLAGIGHVDHRKLFVVDGKIGWMGGAGIEDHFENGQFHDLFVRVTGEVLSQLQATFLVSFAQRGGPLPQGEELDAAFPTPDEAGTIDTTFLMNWPPGWLPVTTMAERLMDGARERLDMTSPYVGNRTVVDRIVSAAERGVRVRLEVPDAEHGNPYAYAGFQHHYDRLLAAGVEIWEYPSLVHAKTIVADDEVLVGTLNLDDWALYRNPEIALHIRNADVAETFRRDLYEVDIAKSRPGAAATKPMERIRNAVLERFATAM